MSAAPVVDVSLASHCLVDVSLEERAAAAKTAGFDGIGLSIEEYDRTRAAGLTDADILSILAQHGLKLTELEAIVSFARVGTDGIPAAGLPRATAPGAVDRMLQVAETLGAGRVQALGTFGTAALEDDVVDRFAALCDQAAGHGVSVCIEFLPITNIPNIAVAESIASGAGRVNGGLCIDSWHFFRGDPDLDALRRIPTERVVMVQLDDGTMLPAVSDYIADTKKYRLLPGQGEFDLTNFLSAVGERPVSAEVLSEEIRSMPAAEAAALIASATRQSLAAARARQLS